MKIAVIGTRGIPNILGGVETHCEELYPRIAASGHDVTVIRRKPYIEDNNLNLTYKGVKLLDVYAPRKKSVEAIIHSTLAVFKAYRLKPDILHVHAIGPSLVIPLARLLGMKVVMTHHGADYNRPKWGRMAKMALRIGEKAAALYANRMIVISQEIAHSIKEKYGRHDTDLVFNGVPIPVKSTVTDYLASCGIKPQRYILAIGRFVEEKGFHDLITAYSNSDILSDYQLVIAGDADHESEYSIRLKQMARSHGVILTGFIKGERLNQLMSNAALFVLPSYHEGLPIALLEAMSYGLDVAVSDISANRLNELTADDFFRTGDTAALQSLIEAKLSHKPEGRRYDLSAYDWGTIADRTLGVYRSLLP